MFEYDRNWIANGFSLSPTELPLQSGLFFADKDLFSGSFATFENSLPDGYGLYLLDRILRKEGTSIKEISPLQRLSIIGTSGMGALSYLPMMPEDTCKAIEYGEAAIPKTFVDDVCKAFPEINRDYVLNGAGDLILEQEGKGQSPIEALAKKVDNLTDLMKNVSDKLDLILKSLSV